MGALALVKATRKSMAASSWRWALLLLVAPSAKLLASVNGVQSAAAPLPLVDCQLTNELGHAVRLSDFHGQALAITFFYTRCPLPKFCPRLSRNFQEASGKLAAMTNAPRNWHFLSVSFDARSDTPETLKAYADTYQYDPAHWSFLTGAPDQIRALARMVGVTYKENSSAR
jgi:cytochrome oxidase Cu insertion factor (SCO1/SenC/PrrC family)